MPRIIFSLTFIIFAVGIGALGVTTAFFSDAETSRANVFTAGDVDLRIDNESYYNGVFNQSTSWLEDNLDGNEYKFFDFGDLKPGDYGEDTISLHVDTNDAYLCADVTLTSNNENGQTEPEAEVDKTTGDDEGELAQLVNFVWWADDGDNVFEDDEAVISEGTLGALVVGEAYPLTLADSVTNIWNEDAVGGPVSGDTTFYIGKAWCFGEMGTKPLPQDGEVDEWSPADDNNNDEKSGTPEDGGITCNGAPLGNESQTDSLTADILFSAVQARHNDSFQCRKPQVSCSPEQAYADHVVSYVQGTKKNGALVDASRSVPSYVLDAPQSTGAEYDSPVVPNSFFSLGFNIGSSTGGHIVVEFTDNIIVDGPGNDLRAWEVTGGSSYPTEKVKIEVSQDGSTWYTVTSSLDRDAEADLAGSGLTWAKYVRLTDVSDITQFEATADGYDLDAFSALNCRAPIAD